MAEHLATVFFPDGRRAYARYSTVVEAVLEDLYPGYCAAGDTLPSAEHCWRATVVGEPEPSRPAAALSPAEELVPVLVSREGGAGPWHAVYCPRRRTLAGPRSGMARFRLQEEFELFPDEHGVRHLRPAGTTGAAVCGAPVAGHPLPFHHPPHYSGLPDPGPAPAPVDLFADWATGTACRRCLLATLPAS